MTSVAIGVIGDFDSNFAPHQLTSASLKNAASALRTSVEIEWLPTENSHDYSRFSALWCAPGSPYRSLEGALKGIRYARENQVPFLGTCGGFQHLVLEFARNVLHIKDAQHAEYDPYASTLFITPLSCSLAGRRMDVVFEENSRVYRHYGSRRAQESYYCNFGLNPEYEQELHAAGLRVTGRDVDLNEARVVELENHPLFVGTLFVPQGHLRPDSPHPLVVGLVSQAVRKALGTLQDELDFRSVRTAVDCAVQEQS